MSKNNKKLTMADTYQSFMYHHGYKLIKMNRVLPALYCPRCEDEQKCKERGYVAYCEFKPRES